MKTKFILETSTLEDVLMKKYQDMKKQDSKACGVCEQTPCQCKKSNEKELAEDHFNHSINDAFKMLDDLMRQERDLDIEPMLKRLSPELQKQLVQWAQIDGKAAVANDEYPEADWAKHINKYLHGVAEGKIDFAKKLQKNVDKHNKAVVQTKKEIGSRVADIGPDAKEYNVKTDKEWDKQKGVTEDQDDECPVHGYYALPNQEDESGCTCDSENRVEEGSFDPQHYFDANKDSKVRRDTEVDQSQHKQDWGRDPLDDITHLAFKAGEKVK
jgi:hypothetical protein